jgi:uncharacterized membrane-anchored protein YjiN (DUF445 family)
MTEAQQITSFAALSEQESALRLHDLRRMQQFATLLLVAMGAIFAAASIGQARWPWLAYIRAFAEASVVGACADWFAIVALFRHPLGIPIPHTAIIPRNKIKIGETVGGFICNNFLAPTVLAERLTALDAAGWWMRWLDKPDNVALIARQFAGLIPPIGDLLGHQPIQEALRDAARRGLSAVPAAPLAGQGLSIVVENGLLLTAAEWLLIQADGSLLRHSDVVREQVSKHTSRWVPKWLDNRLAERVLAGLRTSIDELRAPSHPWRTNLVHRAKEFAQRLESDQDLAATGERIKSDILANPLIAEHIDRLWHGVELRLKSGDGDDDGVIRSSVERALQATARLLHKDEALRAMLNSWTRHAIVGAVSPNRDAIGMFIADVVGGWDDATLVRKVELQVGKDLQYIRINGTVVGGLVGLLIFTVSRLVERGDLSRLLYH